MFKPFETEDIFINPVHVTCVSIRQSSGVAETIYKVRMKLVCGETAWHDYARYEEARRVARMIRDEVSNEPLRQDRRIRADAAKE